MVAHGGKAVGEGARAALLFEPVVNDRSAGSEPTLELVRSAFQAGLVEGDLGIEPGNGGPDVGFPPFLGLDLPLRPHPGLFSGGVAVPPADPIAGNLFGLSTGVANQGEIPDGLPDLIGFARRRLPSPRGILPEAERQRRAECARKAYYTSLAAQSAKARRLRRETRSS